MSAKADEEMNEFERQVQREYERITFVLNNDGAEGMRDFCERTYAIYSEAINAPPNKPCMARTRGHRYKFIASQIVFEEILGIKQ